MKSILIAAGIALAATIGSASAADQFTTLAGVEAQAMSSHAMGLVRGTSAELSVELFRGSEGIAEVLVGMIYIGSFNSRSEDGLMMADSDMGGMAADLIMMTFPCTVSCD